MKLFWGSIVFIAVASFAPLAFGQGTDTWINNPDGFVFTLNPSGTWTDGTKWSNGVPPTATEKPLGTFAVTPAQKAVAGALDPLAQTPSVSFAPLLTIFNNLPASQIAPALSELSPEALQFSRYIAFENSTFLVEKLNSALSSMRSGYGGLDTNGISYSAPGFESSLGRSLGSLLASNAPNFHTAAPNGVNYYQDGESSGPTAPSSDFDSPSTAPSRMTPADAASPTTSNGQVMSDSPVPMRTSSPPDIRTSRFSEFVAGDVVLADINQNSMQDIPAKANYTAGDVMAGISFRMTSNLSVGLLFDYNHTNATTDGNGSKTTVNSYTPGVYATYFDKGFYVNGLFAFGLNDYSNTRNVSFLGESANSAPSGQQYTADLDLGYDFHPAKQWVVGPTLGVTYTHLNIDSFSENGAQLADLNVGSQSADSLRSRLGGHVDYQARVGSIVLQPTFTAMWQHEYLDSGAGITGNFEAFSDANSFTTPNAAPTRDSALLGVGLTATLDNSMSFYFNYFADVGADDYLTQSFIGGVKASF